MASYPDFKWRTIKLSQLDENGLCSQRLASAVYTDSAANERTHLDRKPFGRFNNNDPEKATGQVCRASLSLSPGARTRLCCIATRRLSVSPACFAPGYTWEPPLQFQDEGLPCLLPVAAPEVRSSPLSLMPGCRSSLEQRKHRPSVNAGRKIFQHLPSDAGRSEAAGQARVGGELAPAVRHCGAVPRRSKHHWAWQHTGHGRGQSRCVQPWQEGSRASRRNMQAKARLLIAGLTACPFRHAAGQAG